MSRIHRLVVIGVVVVMAWACVGCGDLPTSPSRVQGPCANGYVIGPNGQDCVRR